MSLDLDIKLNREIRIKYIRNASIKELKKLTGVDTMPDIEIYQLDRGIKKIVDENYILMPKDLIALKFERINEEINLVVTELELLPPYITEDEAGLWAGICVQGGNSIQLLLAIGLALSLSNYCDLPIFDERCFWSKFRISSYDLFFNNLKLDIKGTDILRGTYGIDILSDLVFEKMNKGKFPT